MLRSSVERFDLHTTNVNLTARIVALDCECAAVEETVKASAFSFGGSSFGFDIFDSGLAVDLDRDFLPPYRDVVVKPLFVLMRGSVHDVPNPIEASSFFRVSLGGVDLSFESFLRPAVFLELGVEIESGIGSFLGQNL